MSAKSKPRKTTRRKPTLFEITQGVETAVNLPWRLKHEIEELKAVINEPLVQHNLRWALPRFNELVAELNALLQPTPS